MEKMKILKTDKSTYNQYVEAGLWKPKGNVIFNSQISGKVEADVKVKGGKDKFVTTTIIIIDYFYNKVDFRR
jgi:hypothetical protein